MIKSITLHLDPEKRFPYWHQLPCLKDLHVDFIKGMNIICGYNGCGKTSLLRIMRTLTFCEGVQYSQVGSGSFASMPIQDSIEHGDYVHVDLVNDWNKSCFNLRTTDQIQGDKFDSSIENFGQFMQGSSLSSGMDVTISLLHIFRMIKENKSRDDENIKDFNVQVMQRNLSSHGKVTLAEVTDSSLTTVREYHQQHHVDTDCYTVFLDEPDRSLDVLGCDSLFNFMRHHEDKPFKHSFIAVLHNMSLIYRLRKHSGDHINWIELTPGYLDNVDKFVEGQPITRPAKIDWIHPQFTS